MFLEMLRWSAAASTIIAASMVSWRGSARLTAWGFVLFTLASVAWIAAAYLEEEPALMLQNVVLLAINAFGIYRWFAKAD